MKCDCQENLTLENWDQALPCTQEVVLIYTCATPIFHQAKIFLCAKHAEFFQDFAGSLRLQIAESPEHLCRG
jgi:hypothetical protein